MVIRSVLTSIMLVFADSSLNLLDFLEFFMICQLSTKK